MKFRHRPFIFAATVLVAVALFAPFAHNATAGSSGSVKSRVTNAVSGNYKAYLFRTGDRSPSQIQSFKIGGYQAPTIQFNNVAKGSRYFIRVVDETCAFGGQSSDGELKSGTLSLPNTKVSDSWTSGCP